MPVPVPTSSTLFTTFGRGARANFVDKVMRNKWCCKSTNGHHLRLPNLFFHNLPSRSNSFCPYIRSAEKLWEILLTSSFGRTYSTFNRLIGLQEDENEWLTSVFISMVRSAIFLTIAEDARRQRCSRLSAEVISAALPNQWIGIHVAYRILSIPSAESESSDTNSCWPVGQPLRACMMWKSNPYIGLQRNILLWDIAIKHLVSLYQIGIRQLQRYRLVNEAQCFGSCGGRNIEKGMTWWQLPLPHIAGPVPIPSTVVD